MATPESAKPQPFVAAILKLLRERADLTQEELALELGMSPSEISHLESGRRNPTLGTLQRLAGGLGVRCSQVLALAEELELRVDRP
ncbi:MAG: helix-turn-helix domain-containing protein [Solirubrobacterales bacterium]